MTTPTNFYFPPECNTAERVYLLLGEVPYPAVVFGPPSTGLAPGVEEAVLLEALPGEITHSTATSSYEAGTVFPCTFTGDRATDGRRRMRPCDADSGDRDDD